jgi:hypothetical protein
MKGNDNVRRRRTKMKTMRRKEATVKVKIIMRMMKI